MIGPAGGPPVLLIRICTTFCSIKFPITAFSCMGLLKSATMYLCLWFFEISNFSIADLSEVSFLAINTQLAPSNANSTAHARPIPCVLPQTIAVFPASERFIWLGFYKCNLFRTVDKFYGMNYCFYGVVCCVTHFKVLNFMHRSKK